jgi:hypothetical protein
VDKKTSGIKRKSCGATASIPCGDPLDIRSIEAAYATMAIADWPRFPRMASVSADTKTNIAKVNKGGAAGLLIGPDAIHEAA